MYKVFDFRCSKCQKEEEHLIDEKVKLVACSDCGAPASKQMPAPKGYVKGTSNRTKC